MGWKFEILMKNAPISKAVHGRKRNKSENALNAQLTSARKNSNCRVTANPCQEGHYEPG